MNDARATLQALLLSQPLGVLSTQGGGQPYASLVAFAVGPQAGELLFATDRATRKYANLRADRRVALLVDNRSNRESDFGEAVAVTVVGFAEELLGGDRDRLAAPYLAKHPALREFLASSGCALMRLRVQSYVVVRRFQDVVRLGPDGTPLPDAEDPRP